MCPAVTRVGECLLSYQPLARRYRPQSFAQIVGQDTVCLALRNALKNSKVAPAIIFTGVRGTGKTTLARVLAKSLNCERPTAQRDACTDCESCRAIAMSNHEDVHEIDGASHTGVDDIRELQESLALKPQRSKQRIHIIDEVHMLSVSAFNALLKTLEEPIADTLFIFATTEIAKIPLTIRSRCQIYYLRQLDTQTISEYIGKILQQERVFYDVEVVHALSAQAEGSMRDALTMLDQVLLLGDGKVNTSALHNVTDYLEPALLLDLLASLVTKNTQAVLANLEKIKSSWLDYQRVVEELACYTRHAFILKELPQADLSLPESTTDRLIEIAGMSATLELNRLFRSLVMCSKELDATAIDRYVFENYCLEWCLDPGLPLLQEPIQETTQPENQANSAVPPTAATTTNRPSANQTKQSDFPSSWSELLVRWRKAQPLRARQLEDANLLVYSPEIIQLAVAANSTAAILLQAQERSRIEEMFAKLFSFKGKLEVKDSDQPSKERSQPKNNHPVIKDILERFDGKITDTYTDM